MKFAQKLPSLPKLICLFLAVLLSEALEPTITEPPAELYEAVEGRTVSLRCRVSGAPQPQVSWLRDGKELTGGRYMTQDNGDLEITNLQFMDAGRYKCIARNKQGNDSSNDSLGHLEVKSRTVIAQVENSKVHANDTAIFICNVVADITLEVDIEWLKDEQPIDFDKDPRMYVGPDSSTLVISKTRKQDSGIYTCVAKTRLDEVFSSVILTVIDAPDAPMLVGVKCTRTTAQVEWEPMGDSWSPILSFIVQHNTSYSPGTWEESERVPADDRSFEMFLSPWANYTFRVIAVNEIGRSLPSGHSQRCETPPNVPFKNPEKVRDQGDWPYTLVISWKPMTPIEQNGPGFFYRVYWKRKFVDVEWFTQEIYDWQQTRHVVTNTPTFVEYTIKVEAHNSMGQAKVAATEISGFSGEDVPLEAPKNLTVIRVINERTAELSWDPVPADSLRGHFKGYKIQTWTKEETIQRLREMVVPPEVIHSVVNLFVPFSENFVRVKAFNGQYDGPASEELRFWTLEGKPGAVFYLEALPIGSIGFVLAWVEPENPNGILTGYSLYYEEVDGVTLGPRFDVDPSALDALAREAAILGLKPRTKYRFTVTAETVKGPGDPYFIEARTKDTIAERTLNVPSVPEILHMRCWDSPFANIRWQAGRKNNVTVEYYVIEYNQKYSWYNMTVYPDVWEKAYSDADDWLGISILVKRGSHYTFRIRAVGYAGSSEPSDPVGCITSSDRPRHHPKEVKVSEDRNGNLLVSWKALDVIDLHGTEFYYRVWWRLDEDWHYWTEHIHDYQQTHFVVVKHRPVKSFEIKVEAHNIVGKSNGEAEVITVLSKIPEDFKESLQNSIDPYSLTWKVLSFLIVW